MAPSDDDIRETYVYLLARMLVVRQETTDSAAEGFAYNTMSYNPLGSADFVNPNLDVAYVEAWFAVDDHSAVLLEVPEITGRYYTAQILDEWGEVIVNINDRATPFRPHGTFALTKPGALVNIPDGVPRITLHSGKAKMLARVELAGDPDTAVRLQKQFTATPLGDITVPKPPAIPRFDNEKLMGSEIFDHADAVLASALDVSPVAVRMQLQARAIADYVASSADARAAVDTLLSDTVVPQFREYAYTRSAPVINNWIVATQGGIYGSDYTMRTVANLIGLWANTPTEVVYYSGSMDAAGNALDGTSSYVLHFPADSLPSTVVGGYWSVILLSVPDFKVVPNPANRFNVNSHSQLAYEPDGSLKIGVGSRCPSGVAESNWLPAAAGRRFSLTFRCYLPKPAAREGKWAPPPITVAD
jgi:hypothetical protein